MQITLYLKTLTKCLKGTVSLVKKTIGVSTNLDEQQANDLQDWFCLRENSSVSSFRCMDSILNLMEDDVIYHLNDFFFANNVQSFGK